MYAVAAELYAGRLRPFSPPLDAYSQVHFSLSPCLPELFPGTYKVSFEKRREEDYSSTRVDMHREEREFAASARVRVSFPRPLVRLLPLGRIPPQTFRHTKDRLRIGPVVDRLSANLDEVDACGNVHKG